MQLSPTDYRFRSDLESRQALDSKLAPQNHIAVSYRFDLRLIGCVLKNSYRYR